MLSYERRHLVDLLWYHKRPPGQSATIVEEFGILEEQDVTGSQFILEEADSGAGTDVVLEEDAP